MEKVYIVTAGKYLDYRILRVFRDRAEAISYKQGWNRCKHSDEWAVIEEYEVED